MSFHLWHALWSPFLRVYSRSHTVVLVSHWLQIQIANALMVTQESDCRCLHCVSFVCICLHPCANEILRGLIKHTALEPQLWQWQAHPAPVEDMTCKRAAKRQFNKTTVHEGWAETWWRRDREVSLPLLLKVTFLSACWRTSVSCLETWWMSHSGPTLWAPYENKCMTKPSTVKLTRELWSFPIKSKQFSCHGGVMEIHILRLGNPSP